MTGSLTFAKGLHRRLAKQAEAEARAIRRGAVRALNLTAVSARAAAAKQVRGVLAIKAGAAKKQFRINKATPVALSARLEARAKPIPASAFGVRRIRSGVSVQFRKDKPRITFKGAFVRTMKSGHRGVFRRARGAARWSKGRPRTSSPNLPIKEIFGPQVVGIFEERIARVVQETAPVLEKNLDHEIGRALDNAQGRK